MIMFLMMPLDLVLENGFAIKYEHMYQFIHISSSNYHFHQMKYPYMLFFLALKAHQLEWKPYYLFKCEHEHGIWWPLFFVKRKIICPKSA